MGWRDKYKVHPAADVFPMMSDEELESLAADIKANGLRQPVLFYQHDCSGAGRLLIDGRNRMEALERIGFDDELEFAWTNGDPVPLIISLNIHRRHLTKQQQADLIVAAIKAGQKPPQHEAVSKGGRGKVNPIKQAAIAAGADHGISKSTVERAIAKSEGKTPKPEPRKSSVALELAWGAAKSARETAGVLRDNEDALEIDDELIQACEAVSTAWDKLAARLIQKRASTLPQDGRSEVPAGDPTPQN